MLIFAYCVFSLVACEWWTFWDITHVFYCLGFESGQHGETQRIYYSMLDLSVVNMLRLNSYVLLFGIREWWTCWFSTHVFIVLDSSVVNILRFYEYVQSFWIQEWSTCWDSINLFLYFGLDSGQHFEILPMFPIALDSRLVNMLRVYEHVQWRWTRVVNILRFKYDALRCWVRVVDMLSSHPCFFRLRWLRD